MSTNDGVLRVSLTRSQKPGYVRATGGDRTYIGPLDVGLREFFKRVGELHTIDLSDLPEKSEGVEVKKKAFEILLGYV